MQSRIVAGLATTLTLVASAVPCTADQEKDRLTYVEETKYPVIEEMEANNEALREAAEAKSAEILARVKEAADAREDAKRELRFDVSNIVRPRGPGGLRSAVLALSTDAAIPDRDLLEFFVDVLY